MNAYIPKLMRPKIEREVPLEMESEEHPSIKRNREAAKENEERKKKIEACCYHLAAAHPAAWNELQRHLLAYYGAVLNRNRVSPLAYLQSERDSGYWGICEAFNRGQLIILESLLVTLSVSVPKVQPLSEVRISDLKTLLILTLNKIRSLCHL